MTQVRYLFDSAGNWTAFQNAGFVFAPSGEWLGWFVPGSHDVMDVDGNYLGTVVDADRLFRDPARAGIVDPDHPGYPGRADEPLHPGYPGRATIPEGMTEVDLLEHA